MSVGKPGCGRVSEEAPPRRRLGAQLGQNLEQPAPGRPVLEMVEDGPEVALVVPAQQLVLEGTPSEQAAIQRLADTFLHGVHGVPDLLLLKPGGLVA